MSVDVSVEENWTIEPELADQPPRRLTESGYPDYNKPNAMILYGVGGVGIMGGLILMFVGLAGSKIALAIFGILLALGGAFVAVYLVPQLTKKYQTRVEHLITHGVPVMARLLSADNMGGDNSDGRRLKYQIGLPNGEMIHKDVNADDRVLPKRIPSNVTALMDVNTGDVELYCALPYRAALKNPGVKVSTDPLAPTGTTTTPTTVPVGPGKMGTIAVDAVPEAERPRRRPQEEEAPAKEEKGSGTAGLPWE